MKKLLCLACLVLAATASAQQVYVNGAPQTFSLWNLSIPQPTVNGTVLTYTTGPAALSWAAGGSGGGGTPGGTATELQARGGASTFAAVAGSSVNAGVVTLTGIVTGNSTTGNTGQFGTFGLQSYAVNNAWMTDNGYYNGGFNYLANGTSTILYFNSGAFQIGHAASGTKDAAITYHFAVKTGLASGGFPYAEVGTTSASVGAYQTLIVNANNTADDLAATQLNGLSSGSKILVVQGASGQTANLTEWQDSTGAVIAAMGPGGSITWPTLDAAMGISPYVETFYQFRTIGYQASLGQYYGSFANSYQLLWSSAGDYTASFDVGIMRSSAGVLKVTDGSTGAGGVAEVTANGAAMQNGPPLSEALTLSTSASATATTGNLIPANARIKAIVYRVTTALTTAVSFTVGPTGGNAFVNSGTSTTTQSVVTLGATGVLVPNLYADGFSSAATTLTVTCNATPGAGAIRLTVFYEAFTPPAS